MVVIKGKVIDVDDYFEFKVGNTGKMDYCPITLRTECGDLILLLASTKTMLEKTYMINSKTGNPIQVGMIRPKIGDVLEVEGGLYKSSDQRHSKTMKYIKRITRTIKPRSISERYLL